MVLNIRRGILPVALNIVICPVVGVLDSNTNSFSKNVKEFIVNLSKFKLYRGDSVTWRHC